MKKEWVVHFPFDLHIFESHYNQLPQPGYLKFCYLLLRFEINYPTIAFSLFKAIGHPRTLLIPSTVANSLNSIRP